MLDVRLAMALLILPALAGCIGGFDDPDARVTEGPLVLEASADRRVISPGETVTVRAQLSNQGLAIPEIPRGWPDVIELELVGPDGNPVQRGSERGDAAVVTYERLFPGEREEQRFSWNGTVYDDGYEPAPVGTYAVEVTGNAGRGDDRVRLEPIEVTFEVHPTSS